jgi:hypothetical protein
VGSPAIFKDVADPAAEDPVKMKVFIEAGAADCEAVGQVLSSTTT